MFGLEIETITFLGSALIGMVGKYKMLQAQAEAKHKDGLLKLLAALSEAEVAFIDATKDVPGFSWMRKVFLCLMTLSVVVIPIVANVFYPIPVTYVFNEHIVGGLFTHTRDTVNSITSVGFVILPFMSQIMSAIGGLLCGSATMGKIKC
jgi:hypothetical protein